MRNYGIVLLLLVGLMGCDSSAGKAEPKNGETVQESESGMMTRTKREGEPDIFNVGDSDAEMNLAIETARTTLGDFEKALDDYHDTGIDFSLKVNFDSEHIWISGITAIGGEYFGFVGNTPEWTDKVKFGDFIKIDPDAISDWMYIDDEKIYGGYTLRVLVDRMSEAERKDFFGHSGYTFME